MSVVIVTGAGKGIGASLSKHLAEVGNTVILTDINQGAVYENARSICAEGFNADSFCIDVTDEQSISECVRYVLKKYRKISGVVNNARPTLSYEKFPKSMESWDLAFSVLAKAPALVTAVCTKYLEQTNGSVVNISSTNASFISQQPLAYHAAKAALEQVTKWLAVELGHKGIRVNSVLPGLVDQQDRPTKLSDHVENKLILNSIVPLQRASTPADIANLVSFLLSSKATYITGQSIVVDGGISNLDHFYAVKKVLEADKYS